jgi:hypothetical protein
MIDKKGAKKWIDFLNKLVKIDREAVTKLVNARVPCNRKLADHPTVQVGVKKKGHEVGLLGILNGFTGADERSCGGIAAVIGKNNKVERFISTPRK